MAYANSTEGGNRWAAPRAALAAQDVILRQADSLLDTMLDYKELMLGYSCAMKLIRARLEILSTEFEVKYRRNPISSIQTRLKSQPSVMEKLARKNIPFSVRNIEEHLDDIAGIRVICCYADDIYRIADALIMQDDIDLVERKDYIADPKPNGYRSLHLIVRVPVYFAESMKRVRAEIQIRTIAMDFWASLEHQIKYKKTVSDPEGIAARLRECADTIAETDLKMQRIRQEIDKTHTEPSGTEELFEKLKRFSVTFGE